MLSGLRVEIQLISQSYKVVVCRKNEIFPSGRNTTQGSCVETLDDLQKKVVVNTYIHPLAILNVYLFSTYILHDSKV